MIGHYVQGDYMVLIQKRKKEKSVKINILCARSCTYLAENLAMSVTLKHKGVQCFHKSCIIIIINYTIFLHYMKSHAMITMWSQQFLTMPVKVKKPFYILSVKTKESCLHLTSKK